MQRNKHGTYDLGKKRVLFPRHEELTAGDHLTIALAVHPEDFAINPNLKDGLTLPELEIHIQKLIYKGSERVRFFIAEIYDTLCNYHSYCTGFLSGIT